MRQRFLSQDTIDVLILKDKWTLVFFINSSTGKTKNCVKLREMSLFYLPPNRAGESREARVYVDEADRRG